jgi:hypothetical protein
MSTSPFVPVLRPNEVVHTPSRQIDLTGLAGCTWLALPQRDSLVQYRVYDALGRFLGAGNSEAGVASAARNHRAFIERSPETFDRRVAGSVFVAHGAVVSVVDEHGRVLGSSANGREAAVAMAVKTSLMSRDILELDLSDFARIAYPIKVATLARNEWLFDDETGLRAMVRDYAHMNPGALRDEESHEAFYRRVRAGIHDACDMGSCAFYVMEVAVPARDRIPAGNLYGILYRDPLDAAMSMRYAFNGLRADAESSCERHPCVERM